jgi:mono/diheme cytochrome c family protein
MRRYRLLVGVVAVLAGVPVGCDDGPAAGYDPALRYPLRTDPVVLRLPSEVPLGPPAAGKLDLSIAALPRVGGAVADPEQLPEPRRQELRQALDDLFGTPAAPAVGGPVRVGDLDLTPETLAAGSRVYRRLCTNCHGLTGDGRGPAGPWMYPYPRDIRTGGFKAAAGDRKPTVDEYIRLLRAGVPGSSMQMFDLLPADDLRAVTAYTIHLNLRGETEAAVLKLALDPSEDVSDIAGESRAALAKAVGKWQAAQSAPPPAPVSLSEPPDPEAVRRGMALFNGPTAGCAACHRDYGRQDTYRYDVWGAVVKVHDLTRGEFRWGKDPATIAARVRHGIPPAGMPASSSLTDGQVADLVSFVRELGYPQRLPPDVREKVYPTGKPVQP